MRVHTEYSTSSSDSDNDHLAAPRQGSKVSLVRTVGHISDFPVKKKQRKRFAVGFKRGMGGLARRRDGGTITGTIPGIQHAAGLWV